MAAAAAATINSTAKMKSVKMATGGSIVNSLIGVLSGHSMEAHKFENNKKLMQKGFEIYSDKFNLHKQQFDSHGIPFLPGQPINERSVDHVGSNPVGRNFTTSKIKYRGTVAQNNLGVGRFW